MQVLATRSEVMTRGPLQSQPLVVTALRGASQKRLILENLLSELPQGLPSVMITGRYAGSAMDALPGEPEWT